MEFLHDFLPILIYLLLIIILIVGIILGIKFIRTLTKVEKVVNDVNDKVQSLNGFFHIIDFTTDKIVSLSDKVVDGVSHLISKLLFKRKKDKVDVEREENTK